MITIEETRDWEWMDSIIRRPEVYEPMIFDGGVDREHISTRLAIEDKKNLFFRVIQEGMPVGFFMAEWRGDGWYEIHTNLTKECRGLAAIEAGRKVRDALFQEHGVQKLTSTCPLYNPQSLVFAMRCGMKIDYRVGSEFKKNGKEYGAVHVVLNLGDWEGHICQ